MHRLHSTRRAGAPLLLLFIAITALAIVAVTLPARAVAQDGTGTLELRKVGPPDTESFDIEVRATADADEPLETVAVAGGGSATTELDAATYFLSEVEAEGYELRGWALAEEDVCPGGPAATDDTFEAAIAEAETTVVCVYNAETQVTLDGFLRLTKVGGQAGESYAFDLDGPDETTSVSVDGQSATESMGLDVGAYTISEAESGGLELRGWALAEAVDDVAVCPDEPDSTEATFAFEIVAGEETVICAYNEFPAPEVTDVDPASGPVNGGTSVVITGSGFTGATAVLFGSQPADFTVDSDTQITATAPPAPVPGEVPVVVATPGGQSPGHDAASFTYTAIQPAITLVSPSIGHTAGGMAVGIVGSGFTGATSVTFGSVPAVFTVESDTVIVAVTPPHAAGTVRIAVTTPAGTTADTAADNFTFEVQMCPLIPLWVNDLAYGSRGGGFYWDPMSGMVWTGERATWHQFAPQPPRPSPEPLWTNALTYGSRGGGFYWDPVSGQVWTAERHWHLYEPRGCIART